MKYIKLIIIALFILFTTTTSKAVLIQAGIFNSGLDLIIKAKPDADVTTGFMSAATVTIKYLTSYGISLSAPVSTYGIQFYGTFTSGSYTYKVYTTTSGVTNYNWLANSENEILRVTISGGVGVGDFEIGNDVYTYSNYFEWYIEHSILGDVTNHTTPLYNPIIIGVPLPVNLTYFDAVVNKNSVLLKWGTTEEINNKGFEIEKCLTKENKWIKVGFVKGKGTTTEKQDYRFEENKIACGIYKYRLRQVDYNGNYENYELPREVIILKPNIFEISQNYPNPSNPKSKIDYQIPFNGKVSIKMYDVTGQEVVTLIDAQLEAGYYTAEFNGTNLASGVYFYRIIAEGEGQKFVKTLKMILTK